MFPPKQRANNGTKGLSGCDDAVPVFQTVFSKSRIYQLAPLAVKKSDWPVLNVTIKKVSEETFFSYANIVRHCYVPGGHAKCILLICETSHVVYQVTSLLSTLRKMSS